MEKIYNPNVVSMLLGCLLKYPELSESDEHPLCKEDFCLQYQKIIYASIVNLHKNRTKLIRYKELDNYLCKYQTQYEVFKDCGGTGDIEKYIETIVEISEIDNYESYYNQVRVLSALRDYRDDGFNISKFWDINADNDENLINLDLYTVDDIIGHYELIQINMNQKYSENSKIEEMICGDGFDEVLDELEEDPMIGCQLSQPMLTNLYRGWCKGHLIVEGAPSSFGKTLKGAMDILMVGSLKLYDKKTDTWYDNPYYKGKACLIHSEQKSREEIQTRICSTLAKIPYRGVLDGKYKYNPEERKRLSIAGQITKESGIKIMNYPEFTGSGIKKVLKRLKLEGYDYVVQDYIWNNGWIISDMKKTMGITNVTEQNALLHFADVFKLSCEKLDIAGKSFMQLNDSYKTAEVIDESCLYCGRSVKTKVDAGHISTTPTPLQLAKVESSIQKWNKAHNLYDEAMIKPNMLSSIYKTRYGEFGENVKIWSYIDKAIGDVIDMFATDVDNHPIKIDPMYIKNN